MPTLIDYVFSLSQRKDSAALDNILYLTSGVYHHQTSEATSPDSRKLSAIFASFINLPPFGIFQKKLRHGSDSTDSGQNMWAGFSEYGLKYTTN